MFRQPALPSSTASRRAASDATHDRSTWLPRGLHCRRAAVNDEGIRRPNQPQQTCHAVQQQPSIVPPVHCILSGHCPAAAGATLGLPRCRGGCSLPACQDPPTVRCACTEYLLALDSASGGPRRRPEARTSPKGLVFDPNAELHRVSCPVLSSNRRSPHPRLLSPSLTGEAGGRRGFRTHHQGKRPVRTTPQQAKRNQTMPSP